MPPQSGKSPLFQKHRDRLQKAWKEHLNDETTYSNFGDLPPGIENGVARLVDVKFVTVAEGKQNAGETMFFASGVVLHPKEFAGTPVEGMRTNISEPLWDTPTRSRKTLEDHWGWVMEAVDKLGVARADQNPDQIEQVFEALRRQQPTFRFRTWAGDKQELVQRGGKFYVVEGSEQRGGPFPTEAAATAAFPYLGKEPRTNHVWNGLCPWAGDAESAVRDETGRNGHAAPPAARTPARAAAAPPAPEPEPEPVDEEPELVGSAGGDELDDLVAAAGGDDDTASEAQDRLTELAVAAGCDPKAVASAKTWQAVADMTRVARGPLGEAPTAGGNGGAEEWSPAVDEVYLYRPLDPKTKKPVKQAVECVVTAVDAAARTAALKPLDDPKKSYKNVSWDALEGGG